MAFTGPREAIQDIRELHEIYSDAVMRQDLETYLACWSEDGRRTGTGGECSGKAELRTHWMGIFGAIEQMAFFTQLASITVDGDQASTRSYCLEFMKLRNGASRQVIGDYTDEVVRVGGDWVFSHRHYRVMMTPVMAWARAIARLNQLNRPPRTILNATFRKLGDDRCSTQKQSPTSQHREWVDRAASAPASRSSEPPRNSCARLVCGP